MNRLTFQVMDTCNPLIVILGGTGTGKSKLAIEIAKKLGSEIISADSMQVYKGLDILTNKVTAEERAEVSHHLIDFVSPLINFTVADFRDKSLPIINRLFKMGKSPVIVGGTNYYIESIIWYTLLVNANENLCYSENETNPVLVDEGEIGLKGFSKGTKRKIDELNTVSTDKSEKILNISNELSGLVCNFNKILKTIENSLPERNSCYKIFEHLISKESTDDIETIVKILEDDLREFESGYEYEMICLKCCLTLKNYVYQILCNLKNDSCICESASVSSNLSIEESCTEASNHNSEHILLEIGALILKCKNIVKTHIPQYISIFGKEAEPYFYLKNLESVKLHDLLKNVDLERASNLHPNDKRKILRSLQVWFSCGRKHSDLLKEQQSSGSALGGPLRFKNTIIFWLTADQEVLNKRLDDRVYQMIDRGLVKELLDFYSEYHPKETDFTKGIFQSIGFKEFREFLFLSDEEKHSEIGKNKLNDGIETLKLVTRRYVKYQNKWIKNRFLKYPDRDVPPIYRLDTSEVDRWDELVLNPAMDVITCTIEGKPMKLQPLAKENEITREEIISLKTGEYYCHDCERVFIGLLQWNTHISSKRHKKVLEKKKKTSAIIDCYKDNEFKDVDECIAN